MKDGPVEISITVKVDSSPNYDGETLSQVRREITVAGTLPDNRAEVLGELERTVEEVCDRVGHELNAQAELARIRAENAGE